MYKASKILASNFGCEITGVNLSKENRPGVIKGLKEDLARHRMLIIKDQGHLSPERQLEVTKWFGPVERALFNHPKCCHPDVFRLSNDSKEGIRSSGWGILGSALVRPSAAALYHPLAASPAAPMHLVPLAEFLDKVPKLKLEEWQRLWMVTEEGSRAGHPLVHRHPTTNERLLCFSLQTISGFIYDLGTNSQRFAEPDEVFRIKFDIEEELEKDKWGLSHSHEWEEGDLLVFDNLSLGHRPWPSASLSPEQDLVVLHRTAVRGEHAPAQAFFPEKSQLLTAKAAN